VAQGAMNEQLKPPDPGSIEDARAEAAAAQAGLAELAAEVGFTPEEQEIFVIEFWAAISKARLEERAAKFGFTPGQQAVFDAEFERLRDDVSRRKEIMALPSLKQRATDLDALRVAVEKIKKARAAFLDGPPGFLSGETHAWLSEVDAVAVELATLAKPSRYEILNRGRERPNEYRAWLVGKQIPALFEKVYGKTLRITPEASTARGKRGVNFVHLALEELDERDPIAGPISGQTIKSLIHNAKKYG
jgi:hypothetical protein